MAETIAVSRLPELVGKEYAPTDWLEITQERVDQFADATNDHQFIHVDKEKASQTSFGGTIAHGYLTMSLLSYFSMQSGVLPEGLVMAVTIEIEGVETPALVAEKLGLFIVA